MSPPRDELRELLQLTGWAAATMMGASPQGEALVTPSGAMALCGEACADLNMIVVQAAPDPAALLGRALDRIGERNLPCIAFVDPRAVDAIASRAQAAGLEFAGEIPLMACDPETSVRASRPCEVRQVFDRADARAAARLAALAFSLDLGIVTRAWEPTLTAETSLQTFVAWEGSAARSAVTLARSGASAGVFTMATDPEQHGRGWGRALLSSVMERARSEGVGRFYLQATAAGFPLYQSLGYRTVSELPVYALGVSTQVH